MNGVMSSNFDMKACKTGVVHVGYGAFHRAHQAVYFDALMQETGDLSWGIAAVNLRGADKASFDLAQSDNGYLLKTIDKEGQYEIRRVRSHIAFADWSADAQQAEQLIAEDTVKMVTITVTESGYALNEDYTLNHDDPLMIAEFSGEKSASVYAYLRNALNARAGSGAGPITILCCDNLRSNGKILGQNFKAYLTACGDVKLLAWIKENASFPCCMVDRITPQPTKVIIDQINEQAGTSEANCLIAEDFTQWVVEDDFAAERPALEKVGVEFAQDVIPYEETKIRVLNGGHTALVYLGALAGHKTFDEIMADPETLAHFDQFQNKEVLPALGAGGPMDLVKYLAKIRSRFENKNIADTVERIAMDGVSKFGIFIIPTVSKCFELGINPKFSIRSIASWFVFAKQVNDGQLNIVYKEPNAKVLAPYLEPGKQEMFVTSEELWGDLPKRHPVFSEILRNEINALEVASGNPAISATANF